jgi:hypothetical protein
MPQERPAGSWKRVLSFSLLLAFLYWLYGWRPLFLPVSAVDDGLYISHAEAIVKWLSGDSPYWLGPFQPHLLAKAPLYGIWLALLNLLGLPVRVGEFLLLFAGALMFRQAVRPVRLLRFWEFMVVTFLIVANPMVPENYALQREGLQICLTNMCLIATVGLALRMRESLGTRLGWALLTGFVLGLAYLNREEAVWLVAAVAAMLVLSLINGVLQWRRGQLSWRSLVVAHALIVVVIYLAATPLSLGVSVLNKKHYGAFITSFRRDTTFANLFHRLTSLEPDGRRPYVPIARPTRLKAYELSPTFARMKPYLEEPTSYWSAGNEHSAFNGRNPADKEFFISYFEFCLENSSVQAGAKNAGEMQDMFRAIDKELGRAVRAGKIRAGHPGPALLAAYQAGDAWRIVSEWWQSFFPLLTVNRNVYLWPDSVWQPQARLDDLSRLTHSSVAIYRRPNIYYSAREPVVRLVRQLQRAIYPLLLVAIPVLLIWRRRDIFTAAPSLRGLFAWCLLVPLTGLWAFCFGMAVVNVLGFHFLPGMGYNLLGFAPLSVVCACSFVGLRLFTSPSTEGTCSSKDAPFPAGDRHCGT